MKITPENLMTPSEGLSWHEFKASLGPMYPGYESFDTFMNWMKAQLEGYGCVDTKEHHWPFESYRVNDWPDHDNGSLALTVNGESIPVGSFLMLSGATPEGGLPGKLVYVDTKRFDLSAGFKIGGDDRPSVLTEEEKSAIRGNILVLETTGMPEPPFDEGFLESYVVTDTNYRSDPEPPAEMYEIVNPEVNNSWNTRWDFGQWGKLLGIATEAEAAGLIVVSRLTYGCLKGLYDRQKRHDMPALVIDRVNGRKVVAAAKENAQAVMTLKSEYFPADAWNFVTFLPGAAYGTEADEYITINVHTDAMSLTQDNGALGALGVCKYFAQMPQNERKKTILFCIDSRHFIEGFEGGNIDHDPYRVFPELVPKVSVTIGLEHMGELEGAEDYENNTMVCTGRPEYTFIKISDNDWCTETVINAAKESGLERADVKIDGKPGIHGGYKGRVRAIQASCHNLPVCVMGQAGNWCGAHTQTFSGLEYFSAKKFYQEVYLWTKVTGELMETDRKVYNS